MKKLLLIVPVLAFGASLPSNASSLPSSQYAGQEHRAIKSLSPDDMSELRRGSGWGLAKAAELNGVPGPAHLLELKDEIPLSAEQVEAIEKIYADMKAQAIEQGERLIAQERELESHFQNRTISDDILRSALADIAETRRALRYTHLATHLKTPELLSEEQIATYNKLRGYGAADPCANVPAGHDAAMWRQHNGCK